MRICAHGQLILSNIPLFVCWKLSFEGITYPSSSSRSTRIRLEMRFILTKVLGFGVDFSFSLVVQEQVVHLQVQDHHVGSSQILLSSLNHGNLLSKSASLTESHVTLHSRPVLKLASLSLVCFPTILEALFESIEHHL